ncbi:hypothetical protein [Kribbella sp. NPDC049584]|uniref:hypothetical protein n=1 Tax=Kribbella sp. NPDC049584 TaxID=3154833 RepID=UPI003425AE80
MTNTNAVTAPQHSGVKRSLPALGLFFLSPLVAEFLLGNIPISAFYAILTLAPLYGGGAVLIRELVRRRGWGYPSVIVLALAYGVIEEGITTQSLFNPNYADLRLLDPGHISALGMGAPWTVFVLGLHTVWSITVPIVLMESVSRHPREPWLGKLGLWVYGMLFLAGIVATTAFGYTKDSFRASTGQDIGVGIAIVVLVALAVWIGRRGKPPYDGKRSVGVDRRRDRSGARFRLDGRQRPDQERLARGGPAAGGRGTHGRRHRHLVPADRLDPAAHVGRRRRRAAHLRVARIPGDAGLRRPAQYRPDRERDLHPLGGGSADLCDNHV